LIKVTKVLLWNFIILISLIFIVFIPLELYYKDKANNVKKVMKKSNDYWEKSYPFVSDSIYKLIPGEYIYKKKEFTEKFNINNFGYRNYNFNPNHNVDLVIYGDSFTFGQGVSEGIRFSDIISLSKTNLNIANLAYNAGFTSPHYLLHFNLNKKLKPSQIFVFTFLGNDCQSDLKESKIISFKEGGYPLRIVSDGQIHGDKDEYPYLIKILSKYSYFMKHIFYNVYLSDFGPLFFNNKSRPNTFNSIEFDNGSDKNACNDNILFLKSLEKECVSRNHTCKVTNFLIPQDFFVYKNEDYYFTKLNRDDQIKQFDEKLLIGNVMKNCSENNLECVDLTTILRNSKNKTYYDIDSHWNKYGHKLVADYLLKNYFKKGIR